MKEQGLTKWLQAGYPHFKEGSGLPEWLLPERSFGIVAEGLGDTAILESVRYLDKFPDDAETPEYEGLPAEKWQQVCLNWPHLSHVSAVTTSLFESIECILEKHKRGELTIDLAVIFRSLAVISFTLFVAQGKTVLRGIAEILGGNAASPAELVRRYTDVVLQGVNLTATRVVECIDRHYEWAGWADSLEQMTKKINGDFKLVAVSPPISEGLVDVLAEMIKEASVHGA